ncbi:hypothetical protein [Photobacterium sanguinicancri]|uniref:hypothetical protein n=1 Tax=Photobacterium sanguinicancri TaxID=875932 RepID=UPI0024803999|nr:hypothetical protein [Photobacterium sanguinicancri]
MEPGKQQLSWKWPLAYGIGMPAGAYFGQFFWRVFRDRPLDELTTLPVIGLYVASGIAIVLLKRLTS